MDDRQMTSHVRQSLLLYQVCTRSQLEFCCQCPPQQPPALSYLPVCHCMETEHSDCSPSKVALGTYALAPLDQGLYTQYTQSNTKFKVFDFFLTFTYEKQNTILVSQNFVCTQIYTIVLVKHLSKSIKIYYKNRTNLILYVQSYYTLPVIVPVIGPLTVVFTVVFAATILSSLLGGLGIGNWNENRNISIILHWIRKINAPVLQWQTTYIISLNNWPTFSYNPVNPLIISNTAIKILFFVLVFTT